MSPWLFVSVQRRLCNCVSVIHYSLLSVTTDGGASADCSLSHCHCTCLLSAWTCRHQRRMQALVRGEGEPYSPWKTLVPCPQTKNSPLVDVGLESQDSIRTSEKCIRMQRSFKTKVSRYKRLKSSIIKPSTALAFGFMASLKSCYFVRGRSTHCDGDLSNDAIINDELTLSVRTTSACCWHIGICSAYWCDDWCTVIYTVRRRWPRCMWEASLWAASCRLRCIRYPAVALDAYTHYQSWRRSRRSQLACSLCVWSWQGGVLVLGRGEIIAIYYCCSYNVCLKFRIGAAPYNTANVRLPDRQTLANSRLQNFSIFYSVGNGRPFMPRKVLRNVRKCLSMQRQSRVTEWTRTLRSSAVPLYTGQAVHQDRLRETSLSLFCANCLKLLLETIISVDSPYICKSRLKTYFFGKALTNTHDWPAANASEAKALGAL